MCRLEFCFLCTNVTHSSEIVKMLHKNCHMTFNFLLHSGDASTHTKMLVVSWCYFYMADQMCEAERSRPNTHKQVSRDFHIHAWKGVLEVSYLTKWEGTKKSVGVQFLILHLLSKELLIQNEALTLYFSIHENDELWTLGNVYEHTHARTHR